MKNRTITCFAVLPALVALLLSFSLIGSSVYAEGPAQAGTDVKAQSEGTHAGEHGEGGHGHQPLGLNPLEFYSDTAIWTLVIFLALVVILGKFAFGPIANALDEREKGVADNIASAQQANDEAKNILAQYQQKLEDSRDEVRQIIETARKDAQRTADGIVEKAKESAKLEQDRTIKEIDAATANALQSIAEKSATLATELAGKMIRSEVNQEKHRDLIHGALEEFARN